MDGPHKLVTFKTCTARPNAQDSIHRSIVHCRSDQKCALFPGKEKKKCRNTLPRRENESLRTSPESSYSAKAIVPSARQVGGKRHPARRELVGTSLPLIAKYGKRATKKAMVPIVEAALARLKKAFQARHEGGQGEMAW